MLHIWFVANSKYVILNFAVWYLFDNSLHWNTEHKYEDNSIGLEENIQPYKIALQVMAKFLKHFCVSDFCKFANSYLKEYLNATARNCITVGKT